MTFINLTPHEINMVKADGTERVIPVTGMLARVQVSTEVIGEVDGIPLTKNVYGEVEGLPEPEDDTIYIVSSQVAQRVPTRFDVFVPNDTVRDASGRIIGCRSLAKVN